MKNAKKKGGKERWGNDNEPTQQVNSTHDNINESVSAAEPSDVTYLLSQCELQDRIQQKCLYFQGPVN